MTPKTEQLNGHRRGGTSQRAGGRDLMPAHVAAQPVVHRLGGPKADAEEVSTVDDSAWVMADNGVISPSPGE